MSKELEYFGGGVFTFHKGESEDGPSGNNGWFEGTIHGLPVRIVQIWEHVNGYVKVPEDHPWMLVEDDWDIEADAPGGITYRSSNGWIGFDTNHSNDIWLEFVSPESMRYKSSATHVWTPGELLEAVADLAKQAVEAEVRHSVEEGNPWKALGTLDGEIEDADEQ